MSTNLPKLICFEALQRWRTRSLERIVWLVFLSIVAVLDAAVIVISNSKQISEWILLLAAFGLVGLRVYTRLLVQRQKLRLSEYVLLFSALIGLGLIICE